MTYNMWTHSGAAKAELLALHSFYFSAVGCTGWVFFRRRILTWSDLGTKESEIENKHGVERSEVCGAHFFSRDPTLPWLSGKFYPLQGQELDSILVCPSQFRTFWGLSPPLHRAPWFRGEKSSRIDLRGPLIFFFFYLFQGFLDFVSKE